MSAANLSEVLIVVKNTVDASSSQVKARIEAPKQVQMLLSLIFTIVVITISYIIWFKSKAKRRIEVERTESTNHSSNGNGGIEELDLAPESLISNEQLEQVMNERVPLDLDQWDPPTVLQFIRLFERLGLDKQGLQIFVSYLRKVISTRPDDQWMQLTEQPNANDPANYKACLKNLLPDIVSAIDENGETLRCLCGEDGIDYAICELQKECDSRGISNFYVKLEGFFMEKNVQKAIRINERKPNSIISSMVGDVFYVIEISINRAISTSSATSVNGVLKCSGYLLKDVYTNAMKPNVENVGVEQTLTELAIALNNYEVSIEYTAILVGRIEQQWREESWEQNRLASVREHFEQCLINGTRQLVGTVESKIKPILEIIISGEVIYDEADPWVQRLIRALDTYITCLEPLMTETIYDTCTYCVSVSILTWFRDEIFTLNFNRIEYEQLLNDVGQLAAHLSRMTRNPIDNILDVPMDSLVTNVRHRILQIVGTIGYNGRATWVQGIIVALETNVPRYRPLMSAANYDTFANDVIDFTLSQLGYIVISRPFGWAALLHREEDIEQLANLLASMTQRPFTFELNRVRASFWGPAWPPALRPLCLRLRAWIH